MTEQPDYKKIADDLKSVADELMNIEVSRYKTLLENEFPSTPTSDSTQMPEYSERLLQYKQELAVLSGILYKPLVEFMSLSPNVEPIVISSEDFDNIFIS